ncbi:MAG: GNAT family protein [Roseobacter sp.]
MVHTAGIIEPNGTVVLDWHQPPAPTGKILTGTFAELELLNADKHADSLFEQYRGQDHVWDYMPYGPFPTLSAYQKWIVQTVKSDAHLFYAIKNLETGCIEGVASYLRINPPSGSIEVGHINFSPALQRTRAATEAMYLMMRWAFEAGYRRYEWKCNALNKGSRRAAQRLGLSYEGVFRQAAVVKGRNRDTAWFAAIDSEWPHLKAAFERWLAPTNFSNAGQIQSLSDLTRDIRVTDDPYISAAD